MDDHEVCRRAEAGKPINDESAYFRAWFRGLIEEAGVSEQGSFARLTVKGNEFLYGIEPTACSGWHMGGSEPVASWVKIRRAMKARARGKV